MRVSPRSRAAARSVTPATTGDSIRIVEMPDIGTVTDASSVVGEKSGSGRFAAPALSSYIATSASSPFAVLPSIASLRANTLAKGAVNPFYVTGYAAVSDGGEGLFVRAVADTVSVDNGGTVIVDAAGQRWYRQGAADRSLSVMWFGAKGDGIANDYPAFAAAVAAANAVGGGRIYIPKGYYLLNSTVVANQGNIHFDGDGVDSVIVNGQADKTALELGNGSTLTYNYQVSGLSFATKAGITSVLGNVGLRLRTVAQSALSDLWFTSYPSANYDGLYFGTVSQTTLYGISAQNCRLHGMYFDTCLDIYISNSRSDANAVGLAMVDCQGMYNVNVAAWNNSGNAWRLDYGTTGCFNCFFVNCIGDTSGSSNWAIGSLRSSTFSNCWGATQANTSVNTLAGGFDIVGAGCHDLLFSGCLAHFNNASGVHLIGDASGAPSFITFNGTGFGVSGLGNGQSGTGYGLQIDGNSSHIKVMGGFARNNATAPVKNDATPDIEIIGLAGFISRNSGVGSIPVGGTSVVINHGLSLTPSVADITLCLTGPLNTTHFLYVDSVTSATFTVHADLAPTGVGASFAWTATWTGH